MKTKKNSVLSCPSGNLRVQLKARKRFLEREKLKVEKKLLETENLLKTLNG